MMKRALGFLVLFGCVHFVSGINLQPGTAQDDAERDAEPLIDWSRRVALAKTTDDFKNDGDMIHNMFTFFDVWEVMRCFAMFEDIYIRRYFRRSDGSGGLAWLTWICIFLIWRTLVGLLISMYMVCHFFFGTSVGRVLLVLRLFFFN